MPTKRPKLKTSRVNDIEIDITKHKVKKPAICPECGANCYYLSNGEPYLACYGKCGKTYKESEFTG